MKTLYKLATLDYIVLYKKSFPLCKGLTFSRYMKILDELDFSPYAFLIKEVPLFGYYVLDLFFQHPIFPSFVPISPFSDFILLNKCTIRYSKDNQEVSLEAGASLQSIFIFAVYFAMLILMIFVTFVDYHIIFVIFATLISILLVAVVKRDLRRYQKMEAVAINSKKKTQGK